MTNTKSKGDIFQKIFAITKKFRFVDKFKVEINIADG